MTDKQLEEYTSQNIQDEITKYSEGCEDTFEGKAIYLFAFFTDNIQELINKNIDLEEKSEEMKKNDNLWASKVLDLEERIDMLDKRTYIDPKLIQEINDLS